MTDNLTEADRALCEALDDRLMFQPAARIRELSRQLAAAEADAARLAEALGQAQHFMERAFADPDSLKDRLSTMDCFADQLGRNRDALAAHTARLIDG